MQPNGSGQSKSSATNSALNANGRHHASTHAVHDGESKFRAHHSLTIPIVQTAVYTFDSCADLQAYTEDRMFWDEIEREEYGRYGNPTNRAVEAKLAALEGAEDAILLSSGMTAITSTLLLLLQQGDHMLSLIHI